MISSKPKVISADLRVTFHTVTVLVSLVLLTNLDRKTK